MSCSLHEGLLRALHAFSAKIACPTADARNLEPSSFSPRLDPGAILCRRYRRRDDLGTGHRLGLDPKFGKRREARLNANRAAAATAHN